MRKITFFWVILVALPLFAGNMPDNYYTIANGKSDSILKSTLSSIIRDHTVLSYGSGDNSSWYCFYYADRDTVTNLCMDMYCDSWKAFTTPGAVVSGCNVEHSFAKSWWGGTNNDAYKDCYHLNPSNSTANSSRSNYPPAVPTQDFKDQSVTGSLKVGKRYHEELGEYHYVFEPKDEYKGDFARAYFYMVTCYGDELTWRLDNKDVGSKYAMQNDNYLEFQPWFQEVLLKWHRQDPVSTKEINRANAVNNFQGNRNPFIDYPCLAEYIWGNKKGENVDFSQLMSSLNPSFLTEADKSGCDCTITTPTLTSPRKNSVTNLGNVAIDSKRSATITVKGVLLTQTITLSVSGANAAYFTVNPATVSAAQALNGFDVTVSYQPTVLGTHTATLTLASAELGSVPVVLSGSCAFEALPATNVTETGFTANWSSAGVNDYTLDVFVRETTGTKLDSLINEPELTSSAVGANDHLSIGGKTYYETEGLRLGTGSGDGTLVISGLDVSQGGTLVVRAKKYGSDNSTLKVSVGTNEVDTKTLTENYADYTFQLTASTSEAINLTQGNTKQRLVISGILLTKGGQVISDVSLAGYPKSVGNVLSYNVEASLNDGRTYYYTVTPVGFGKSKAIKVEEKYDALDFVWAEDIFCLADGDGLHVVNLPQNASVSIYDVVGRLCAKRSDCQTEELFNITRKGVYMVQICSDNRFYTLKTITY